jgi:hypothetical protein
MRASSFAAALCAGTAIISTPAHAQLKLSQIYGAGGNTQSPLLNDYIDLQPRPRASTSRRLVGPVRGGRGGSGSSVHPKQGHRSRSVANVNLERPGPEVPISRLR